ncbi:MAG: hypothetical protein K2N67_06485 [Mucispirillum sp.]|nr:hypothetical protein [Mucispirillum sp.]
MLDKNELEDLLVKLRLGTISVESAIEEIETSFYANDKGGGVSPWRSLGYGFDEVIFCKDKPVSYIERTAKRFQEKHIDFICVGLDESGISELSGRISGCDFILDAGMIICAKNSAENGKADIRAAVFSTLPREERIIRELEESLKIAGIDYDFFYEHSYGAISPQILKNRLCKAGAAVIADESGVLLPMVSAVSFIPVIVIPVGKENDVAVPYGAAAVSRESGFAASAAILRCVNKK